MKILLEPQVFSDQVYGGISRYYTEVFLELNQNPNLKIDLPLISTKNAYVKNTKLYNYKNYKNFYIKLLSSIGISTRKLTKKINQNKNIEVLKKQDYDLVIPTYYNPYFLEYIGNKPFVLTVYDMIHELMPQYFDINDKTTKNKLLLMERAKKIIAVSNNTKKDILKIYPQIDASKIEVIYHGNSIKINHKEIDLPKKYLLFVGVRENYKNFNFFLNSVSEILINDVELMVVCAGGGKFKETELEFIKNLRLEDKIIQKSFNDDELGMFYKNAVCFIFPSEYEGFGIPVLESMACGCPIVLTNNSSFPEVAGEAGLFFELNNPLDLKNKVELLLNNQNLRNEYADKGLTQIKKFDWKSAALQCYEVYNQAIQN